MGSSGSKTALGVMLTVLVVFLVFIFMLPMLIAYALARAFRLTARQAFLAAAVVGVAVLALNRWNARKTATPVIAAPAQQSFVVMDPTLTVAGDDPSALHTIPDGLHGQEVLLL